jgi:hypothetical protein
MALQSHQQPTTAADNAYVREAAVMAADTKGPAQHNIGVNVMHAM